VKNQISGLALEMDGREREREERERERIRKKVQRTANKN